LLGVKSVADTVTNNPSLPLTKVDTLVNKSLQDSVRKDTLSKKIVLKKSTYRPDINKVVWRSAILPGYGQVANHQAWKLPIVYAGFVWLGYLVYLNNEGYNLYRRMNNIYLTNPNSQELDSFLKQRGWRTADNVDQVDLSNLDYLSNSYRTNRDLSIIGCVALYGLTVLDAYVSAQLFDYDISPNLSLKISPSVSTNQFAQSPSVGIRLSLNLK
jgi:Family of unknown function (DUF5683)